MRNTFSLEMTSWMERDGSQTAQGQESREDEEGLHSGRTKLLSGQHMSYELELCPAGEETLWSACHASQF